MPDVQINGLPLLGASVADAVIPLQRPGDTTKGVRLDGLGAAVPDATIGQAKVSGLVSSLALKQRTHRADVRDFGVLLNGTGDNTAGLTAAAASLGALGGEVYVPPGTVTYAGPLNLPSSVDLVGDGPACSVLRCTSTTANMVTSTSTNHIAIRDIQLESLATRTAGSAIAFDNVSGYIIDNVRIIDPFNAGTFTNSHLGWLSRLKIAHGAQSFNRGFYWTGCIDTHVTCSLINGGTINLPSGNAWFMIDSSCDTWQAHDVGTVASSGSGTGFRFCKTLGGFAPRWVRLSSVWCEGSSGSSAGRDGMVIDDVLDFMWVNGYIATSQNGLVVNGGNLIRVGYSIFENSWLRGVVLSGGNHISFDGCAWDSNSQGADNNVGHLYVGPSVGDLNVLNSYFGQDVLSRTNKVNYAIENYAPMTAVTVRDCRFSSSQYGTAVLGGTTIPLMRDNRGYNPRGPLTAPAIPATTVAHTNVFGVDCSVYVNGGTVSAVAVAGATTGQTSGLFRVRAGQTITLTYTVAPTWVWIGE